MASGKQTGLIAEMSAKFGDKWDTFKPITERLIEMGYKPARRKKSTYMVEFEKYGKIISKMELSNEFGPLFWFRFSGCKSYPPLFHQALRRRPVAWVKRGQDWQNHDKSKCCGLCRSEPRFYRHMNNSGEEIERCSGYTVAVPGVTVEDVPDILRMIDEQDEYFKAVFGT